MRKFLFPFWSLSASGWLFLAAFFVGVPCMAQPRADDLLGLSINDETTKRHLRQAEEHLRHGRTPEALALLQRVLDDLEQHYLTQTDGRQWQTARQVAEKLICDYSLLTEYRRQHEPHAEHLLRSAAGGDRVAVLEALSKRFLLTAAGAKAANQLATLYLDRGQASLAWTHLDRLLQCPAHQGEGVKPIRAKLAVAAALLGKQDQARALLEQLQEPVAGSDRRFRSIEQIHQLVDSPFPEASSRPTMTNELLLLRGWRSRNHLLRSKALLGFSELCAAAGFAEDAVHCRELAARIGKIPLDGSPTATDEPPVTEGKPQVTLEPEPGPPRRPAAVLFPQPDCFPFYSARAIAVFEEEDRLDLVLMRLADGDAQWTASAPRTLETRPSDVTTRFACAGHFAFLIYGQTLYAVSGVDGGLMWSYPLPSDAVRLPVVNPEFIALTMDRDLMVLDAMSGSPMWKFHPLETDNLVFSDADTLFANADAEGQRFNLFRVSDGALSDHRQYDVNLVRYAFAKNASEIVVVQLDFTRGGLIAYALDVATKKELWSKVFKLGTRYFRGEEDELILLEPRGRLVVLRTSDGSVLLEDELALDLANKTTAVRYFSDRRSHYVLFDVEGTRRRGATPGRQFEVLPVTGPLRAYDKQRGDVLWETTPQADWLVRRPADGLPGLLCLSEQAADPPAVQPLRIDVLDKRSGAVAQSFSLPFSITDVWISSAPNSAVFANAEHAVRLRFGAE